MPADKRPCPQCKYPNPPAATKCEVCGRPLGGGAGKKSMPAPTLDPQAAKKLASPPALPDWEPPEEMPASTIDPPASVPLLGSPPYPYPALVRILEGGGDGETFCVKDRPLILGRSGGDILFPGDTLLSGRHASVASDGHTLTLRDLQSRNGTFVRRNDKIEIVEGMETLIGLTLIRWSLGAAPRPEGTMEFGEEPAGIGLRAAILRGKGLTADDCPLEHGATVGAKGCKLELHDKYVSPLHARVVRVGAKSYLVDEKSANGTYVRIPAEQDVTLKAGEVFRVGRQILRFELRGA